MKLLWLNCNKGGCGLIRSRSFYAYFARQQADVLLLSELKRSELETPQTMEGYTWAFHSRNLGIAIRSGLNWRNGSHMTDFYASVVLENELEVASVYLDSGSAKTRKAQLQDIRSKSLSASHDMLVGGDFNTVLRLQDGIFDGRPSTWVKPGEKRVIEELLQAGRFADPYQEIDNDVPDFSYVGAYRGKLYAFRSDFVLCSPHLKPRISVVYDGSTRARAGGFSDHSAVVAYLQ